MICLKRFLGKSIIFIYKIKQNRKKIKIMATSNKVFVSPGVYTSERDLSFVAQSVGVTTLGIVGETLKGPAFEPIFITSFDEFQAIFGGTSPEKFVNTQIPKYEAAYIAKSYLQQSNQLFVTRILGLSGYDAGPSWSITSVANVSGGSVSQDSTLSEVFVTFTGSTAGVSTIEYLSGINSTIFGNDLYNTLTLNDGSSTTIDSKLKTFLSGVFSTNSTSATTAYVFGTIPDSDYNSLTGNGWTTTTNVYNVPSLLDTQTDYSSRNNDAWYYAQFNIDSGNAYSGYSFTTRIDTLSANTFGVSGQFSGSVSVSAFTQIGTAYTDYNNVVLATLRSRGVSDYSNNTNPDYQVTGLTDVTLSMTGVYSGATKSPYSQFGISGVTYEGDTFEFTTSLDSSDANYIAKVFGQSNFGKNRTEVPLFVEEKFNSYLNYGYSMGYIRGINNSLISLPSAQDDNSTNTSIGWYLEQYQTPETPYVVSELRGNTVYDLFKFISISDGNAANREIKISILNVSFANGTFDVGVRDFNDTDANPVFLEKFTNCSMNPSNNNFVGVKIGTSDGEYQTRSKYIMLEINSEAPVDALPCGFRGYPLRTYNGANAPSPIYKLQYLTAGANTTYPPFGSQQVSSGDKVNRTYLGISNTVGIDQEYYDYKGEQNPANLATDTTSTPWSFLSKGFHLDSGATAVTITSTYSTSGESVFEVGVASFSSEPTDSTSPYYRLNARKYTLVPAGGFDGWDIYREYRTNGDNFVIGGSGFLKGFAPDSQFPTATGWGAFKKITVDNNSTDWANTDYYAYLKGQKTFENPEAVNINIFVTPGIDYVNNSNLVEDAIDMIENDRADSLYVTTTPDYNMFLPNTTGTDGLIYPQEAVDNLETTGIDSNYTATYYPWVLTRDSVNNTQIYLPPTAEVCRNLALTDNIAFPWFASAGYTRGIVNSIKARKKLTQEDRDALYQGHINPIATFSDVGTVIWGNKTTQVADSALDRINVRRLLLQARKLISAVAVRLLFEQNDEKVRQDFLDSVNPILDSIRRDRGLIDFRVVVTNTPEDLDRNQMTGKIYLKPTKALEFIDIEFLITPSGASFENI
jgi:hypothetical protein